MSDSPQTPQNEQIPMIEIAQSVMNTLANPTSLPVLVSDLELVHQIVTDVKAKLQGKHPSLWLIMEALFNASNS